MRADPGPGPRDGRTATARPGVLCRLCRVRDCDGLRAVLLWFAQQGTVSDDGLLHRLGEVLPDVPPVRHVDGVRRAEPSGLGEREGTVAADHLDTGMAGQPLGHRRHVPVGQQNNRPPGLDVHQDGGIDVPFAQRELGHPEHPRRVRCRFRQGPYQAQQRGTARGTPRLSTNRAPARPASISTSFCNTSCRPALRRP